MNIFQTTNVSNENELERVRKQLADCKAELRQRKTELSNLQTNVRSILELFSSKIKKTQSIAIN